jgi:hypothetical protein
VVTSADPKEIKAMPRKSGAPSKTAFVLGLSSTMPAKEVLSKAKAAGFALSEKYVYVIRSKAKAKRKGKRGPGRPPKAAGSTSSNGAMDARFAAVALDLGLARAEEILRSVRSKARSAAFG